MGIRKLEEIANSRGLVSVADAVAQNVSRMEFARFRRRRGCKKVLPRVYAVPSVKPDELRAVRAALLWAPSGVVSHRSALWLWDLLKYPPATVEMTVESRRAPSCAKVRIHRSEHFSESDQTVHRGVRVTTVARTLLDAARYLSEEELMRVLEAAIHRKLISLWQLKKRLAAHLRGWRGAHLLKRLWREHLRRGRAMESPLEVKVWRFLRRARLPRPEVQAPFRDELGQPGRMDFLFAKQRVAVECQGRAFHGADAFEKDALRRSRLAAVGYRIVEVTSQMLDQPDRLEELLRNALSYTTRRDEITRAYERGERERRRAERLDRARTRISV